MGSGLCAAHGGGKRCAFPDGCESRARVGQYCKRHARTEPVNYTALGADAVATTSDTALAIRQALTPPPAPPSSSSSSSSLSLPTEHVPATNCSSGDSSTGRKRRRTEASRNGIGGGASSDSGSGGRTSGGGVGGRDGGGGGCGSDGGGGSGGGGGGGGAEGWWVKIHVPDMMCEGSCARTVRGLLGKLDVATEPLRLDFPRRAFYMHTGLTTADTAAGANVSSPSSSLSSRPSDAALQAVVEPVLDGSGFDAMVSVLDGLPPDPLVVPAKLSSPSPAALSGMKANEQIEKWTLDSLAVSLGKWRALFSSTGQYNRATWIQMK